MVLGGIVVLGAGAWSVGRDHGPGDGDRGPGRVLVRVGLGTRGRDHGPGADAWWGRSKRGRPAVASGEGRGRAGRGRVRVGRGEPRSSGGGGRWRGR